MATTLTEQTVLEGLTTAVEHLKEERLELAEEVLRTLDFDRILRGYVRSRLRRGGTIHPSLVVGRAKALETGNLIRKCRRAILREDPAYALSHANDALRCWKSPPWTKVAGWYKVAFTLREIQNQEDWPMVEEFILLRMEVDLPRDAALFRDQNALNDYYFSPGALRIAWQLVGNYGGRECTAPCRRSLTDVVVEASARDEILAVATQQADVSDADARFPAPC